MDLIGSVHDGSNGLDLCDQKGAALPPELRRSTVAPWLNYTRTRKLGSWIAQDIPRRAGGRGERVSEDGVDAGRLLLRVLLVEVGAGGGSI